MRLTRSGLTAAALGILVMNQLAEERTAKHAALAASFTELCGLVGKLKKSHNYAAGKLSKGTEEITSLKRIYQRLYVYSLMDSGTVHARLAKAVAALAERLIESKSAGIASLTAKALTATTRAGLVAGAATEFIGILDQATTSGPTGGGCIITADTGNDARTWTGRAASTPGCNDTTIEELTTFSTKTPLEINLKSVTPKTDAGATMHAKTGCMLLGDADSAGVTLGNKAYASNKIYYVAGAITVDDNPDVKVTGMGNLRSDTTQARWSEAEQALNALDSPSFGNASAAASSLYNYLTTDNDFLVAALLIIANETAKPQSIKTDNQKCKKIMDIVGVDSTKFTNPYLHNIGETTLVKDTNCGINVKDNKLKNLDSDDQYSKLLLYYTSQPEPDDAETTCPTETATPKDDAANQKMFEKFHNKPKDCTEKTCTYDTKTNKCNPIKPVEGAETVSGTGEGTTGTTTDKCAAATTPEECAKVTGTKPESKNAVCRWIEGKCQDSSFLTNKKLVLSMAALFCIK
uniref:Variant surface glycoprotein 386 n=1 Tax=Trypanosoma brucei TaxID=5691 RepID=M4T1M5_9TRYP|nr:variant surface glycoprotein 386 [Trypanosoma brucei]